MFMDVPSGFKRLMSNADSTCWSPWALFHGKTSRGAIPMTHQTQQTSFINPGLTPHFRPNIFKHIYPELFEGELPPFSGFSGFFLTLMLTAVLFFGQRKWQESVQLCSLAQDVQLFNLQRPPGNMLGHQIGQTH